MIAEEIADLLETEGVGTVETDIFIGDLVYRKEDGLFLVNAPSPAPNEAIQIYEQIIDFWTRYRKSDEGYQKLMEVQDVLHQKANYELDSWHVFLSHSYGAVEDMDRDIERRKLHKLSMRLIYRPLD